MVSSVKINNKETVLRLLCSLGSQRGSHSAGVALINNDNQRIIKDAIHPFKFAETHLNSGLANNSNVVIGHTRHATHGVINKDNAHPFLIGNTIGAHNGVVGNIYTVKQDIPEKYEVDSQYLLHLLDKQNNLGKAYGTMNVTYWKHNDDCDLRIIRCNYPMSCAYIYDKNDKQIALIYASLEEHLDIVLQTFAFKYTKLIFNDYHRFDIKIDNGEVKAYVTDLSDVLDSFNKNYNSYTHNTYYHRSSQNTTVNIHQNNHVPVGTNLLPHHYKDKEDKNDGVINFSMMDEYDIDELLQLTENDTNIYVDGTNVRKGTPVLLG